ncbi:MAG: putative MATE family efflux protein [Candidatus Promineifilaceae bacterium]|jgi:putative MATE family efflux protein
MSKSNLKNPLISEPIPAMLRKIAIPVGIGAFFNTMFNVVDTIYGGLISDEALAALSLSFPIFFVIIAVGVGFSSGNSALVGNALGRGERKEAERLAIQGMIFGVLISAGVTLLILATAPSLVRMLGATDPEYQANALAYLNPIFGGMIFFITNQMLISTLNPLGITIPGRNFLVTGFLLNLALDPWFIFGGFGLPAMGITGIALATIFVQFLGCLYLAFEVSRAGLITAAGLRQYFKPDFSLMRQIAGQGVPIFADLMALTFGFFAVTWFASQFGQKAVAAYGAAGRIEQLALLPLIGIDVATLALVSQNNGAKLPARIHETVWVAAKYGMLIMLIMGTLIFTFARPVMRLFTEDPEILATGIAFIRIRSFGLIPNALFFASASAMRGIKKPILPMILNYGGFVVLPVILILIFVKGFNYGVTAIWWATMLSITAGGLASWLLTQRALAKI